MISGTVAPKGTVRYYRQHLAAVAQRLSDLEAPISEGYQHPPKMVEEGLRELLNRCHALNWEWAKADSEAVGGEIVLKVEPAP